MCLQAKDGGKVSFTIKTAGQVFTQTIEFVYMGEAVSADRELIIEITQRLQRVWACFQRYKMELHYYPGVCLRLNVRLLNAEMIETLICGCMMWGSNKPDYGRLRDGFTTPCSSDTSDGVDGNARATPHHTPTRLPRQHPKA